jgi:membrane-associated phospholipid phosphatase
LRHTFKRNTAFFLLYILFFSIALPVILLTEKVELHIFFNRAVSPLFNFFFEYVTYLGDGIFVIAVSVMLLFINVRKATTVLAAYGLSAGFTQGIKYAFFSDMDRPQLFFQKLHLPLTLIQNLSEEQHIHHSFPSGHSTAAFALFFCLGFFSKEPAIKIICFLIALMVAFSRVYLSQHFFEDITAGSFVAVLFSSFICWFFYLSPSAHRFDSLEKPIYKFF